MVGMLDHEQIRRVVRVYRAARTARSVRLGHRKAKRMLDDHAAQTDALVDVAEFAERVREKCVEPEDVQAIGRGVVNSLPRVYHAVARHIKKTAGQD